jgi:protein-tyrosine sulfotransferase
LFFIKNRVERSSDQVIKPINLEALTKWVGNIPEDVVHDMANIAPMLSILGELGGKQYTNLNLKFYPLFLFTLTGYDPYANPPNYGNADDVVKENTNKVRRNGNWFHLMLSH